MANGSVHQGAVIIAALCVVFSYASLPCPKLSLLPGTIVDCELPVENRTIECMNGTSATSSVPRGTIGRYRCERGGNVSTNIVKCACKGKWKGLKQLNEFMSNCNISDYSNDGPAELNLTNTEIMQLALPTPEAPDTKDFQEDGVAFHNFYRNIHHAPSLELNQTLSDAAQKWADLMVNEPELRTQNWSERWYSQNLYRVFGSDIDAREATKLAVAAWYQGAYRYNWDKPTGQSAFSQLVWKSTSEVGLGVAQRGNQTVVVANYYPPGNVIVSTANADDKFAWFKLNVLPPNQEPESSTASTSTTTTTNAPSTSVTVTGGLSSLSVTITTTESASTTPAAVPSLSNVTSQLTTTV